METFIARQPIFEGNQKVYGYELLFRSSLNNMFSHSDPDQASSKVLADSFFLLGLPLLTGGKRAFINVTREILLKEFLFLIPKDHIVIEVLEDVIPDAEVISACQKLKKAGYLLAMDDFIDGDSNWPLVQLTDFIKVDFLLTGPRERKSLLQRYQSLGIRFLAEKVETPDTFREALEMGYHYFQGYFFSKPKIIAGKDIPGYKLHYFRILQETQRPELDFKELGEILKKEVSLSYKLLRYINSAFFGLRSRIASIMQALVLLGEKEIRKWVSLVVLATLGEDKPEELVLQAVIRARFCESLAPSAGLVQRQEDLFLMGMFSSIDAILDRPLTQILQELPIQKDIKEGLLGLENPLARVYRVVLKYEKGEWDPLSQEVKELGIDEKALSRLYLEAVEWGHRCFQG
jgi:EAL and modified HD-GYP domain-containing signal transduction protein